MGALVVLAAFGCRATAVGEGSARGVPYRAASATPRLAFVPSARATPTPVSPGSHRPLELVPQLGHLGEIEHLALTPDGRNLVTASADGSLKLWDVETSAMLRTFNGKSPARCVKVMPDGNRALAGYQNGEIVVWELATGDQVVTLSAGKNSVDALAVSPDGQRLYSSSRVAGSQLLVWDLAQRTQLQSIEAHPYGIPALALSPDGRYVATGGNSRDGRVKIRDTSTFKVLQKLGNELLSIEGLVFSPDGKTLAAAADKSGGPVGRGERQAASEAHGPSRFRDRYGVLARWPTAAERRAGPSGSRVGCDHG